MTDPEMAPEIAVPSPDGIESRIARDLVRHALWVAPVAIVGVGSWRGLDGALAIALAFALVIVNFLASAAILGWTARISPNALMAAALGSFVLRLGILFGIGLLLQDAGWLDLPVFVVTVLVAHLGLLFWETRSISLSLASPGLKPRKL